MMSADEFNIMEYMLAKSGGGGGGPSNVRISTVTVAEDLTNADLALQAIEADETIEACFVYQTQNTTDYNDKLFGAAIHPFANGKYNRMYFRIVKNSAKLSISLETTSKTYAELSTPSANMLYINTSKSQLEWHVEGSYSSSTICAGTYKVITILKEGA